MPDYMRVQFRFVWKLFIAALCIVGLWLFIRFALLWLSPFLLAFLLASLCRRPAHWLTRELKLHKSVAGGLLTLTVAGLFCGICYLLVSRALYELGRLAEQLPYLMTKIPEFTGRLSLKIDRLLAAAPLEWKDFLARSIDNIINEGMSVPSAAYARLGTFLGSAAAKFPSALLFLLALLLSFYFMCGDYDSVSEFVSRQIPESWRERVEKTREHLSKTLLRWLRAQLTLLLITFAELTVGLTILGVQYPLLLGAVVALIDMLPVLGTGTVLIPWALITMMFGNMPGGIGLLVLYAVITLVRAFSEPKIVGKQIGLPPLVSLISIYIGFRVFGIIGMLFAPVLVLTVKQMQDWGYFRLWK